MFLVIHVFTLVTSKDFIFVFKIFGKLSDETLTGADYVDVLSGSLTQWSVLLCLLLVLFTA